MGLTSRTPVVTSESEPEGPSSVGCDLSRLSNVSPVVTVDSVPIHRVSPGVVAEEKSCTLLTFRFLLFHTFSNTVTTDSRCEGRENEQESSCLDTEWVSTVKGKGVRVHPGALHQEGLPAPSTEKTHKRSGPPTVYFPSPSVKGSGCPTVQRTFGPVDLTGYSGFETESQ